MLSRGWDSNVITRMVQQYRNEEGTAMIKWGWSVTDLVEMYG